ncbi:MAG: NUDIX domain-containing protein [Rhodospirillaceae bacterium]|nr:NUDIX domain-containing protein [Rhodospirillaceae bacterium]
MRVSAGILLYRLAAGANRPPEFLLVHPGGPFWAKKDLGAWSIPKGEIDPGEEPLAAARREFAEETGLRLDGTFAALTPVKQPGGKLVRAWALEGDCDPVGIRSNECEIEWPPRSGRTLTIPEIDRANWFDTATARAKIQKGQAPLIEELAARLARR